MRQSQPTYRKAPREFSGNREAWGKRERLHFTDTHCNTVTYPRPIKPIVMPKEQRPSKLKSALQVLALSAFGFAFFFIVAYLDGVA